MVPVAVPSDGDSAALGNGYGGAIVGVAREAYLFSLGDDSVANRCPEDLTVGIRIGLPRDVQGAISPSRGWLDLCFGT